MSLLLFILAAIGGLIFLIAYIILVVASFRHHTVTGLISLIPGINLVVLPTILGKTGKAFPTSVFGLGLALVSWYAGGNHYLQSFLQNSTTPVQETIAAENTTPSNTSNNINSTATHKTKNLPLRSKPLYYIIYTKVDKHELGNLPNQYIRVKLVDDRVLEGKNTKTTATHLLLQTYDNAKEQVVKISLKHIVSVEKLETKG